MSRVAGRAELVEDHVVRALEEQRAWPSALRPHEHRHALARRGELVDGENVERMLLAVEEVVERGRGALDELPANTARGLDKRALVGRGGL